MVARAKKRAAPAERGGRRVCIICQKEREGQRVRDDLFIRTVRSLKRRLGIATNNVLVVCRDCVPEHRQRRSAFERKLLQYGAFGAAIGLILLVLSRSLQGLAMGLLLGAFVASLALFQYHPSSDAMG